MATCSFAKLCTKKQRVIFELHIQIGYKGVAEGWESLFKMAATAWLLQTFHEGVTHAGCCPLRAHLELLAPLSSAKEQSHFQILTFRLSNGDNCCLDHLTRSACESTIHMTDINRLLPICQVLGHAILPCTVSFQLWSTQAVMENHGFCYVCPALAQPDHLWKG